MMLTEATRDRTKHRNITRLAITALLFLLVTGAASADTWQTSGNDAYYGWEPNTFGLRYNSTAIVHTSIFLGKYVLIGTQIQSNSSIDTILLPLETSVGSPTGNITLQLENGNATESYHTLLCDECTSEIQPVANTINIAPLNLSNTSQIDMENSTWIWVNITAKEGSNSTNAYKLNDKNGKTSIFTVRANETAVTSIPAIAFSGSGGDFGNYYTGSIVTTDNAFLNTYIGQTYFFNHTPPSSLNLTNFTVFMKYNAGEASLPRLVLIRTDTGAEVMNVTNTTTISSASFGNIVFVPPSEVPLRSGVKYTAYISLRDNVSATGVALTSRIVNSNFLSMSFGGTDMTYNKSTNSGSTWTISNNKDLQMWAGLNYTVNGTTDLYIESFSPSGSSTTTTNLTTATFQLTTSTIADTITWSINGTVVQTDTNVYLSTYVNSTPAIGNWNVSVTAVKGSSNAVNQWNWTVIDGTPPPGATENTYYVDASGNDANDGRSLSTAFATLTQAASIATAGDTIKVVNGTYYNETKIKFLNSGNATHPISITSYNGSVLFQNDKYYTCGGPLGLAGAYVVFDFNYKSYITISNLSFQYYDGFSRTTLNNAHDIIFDNISYFDSGSEITPFAAGTYNIQLKNSRIYNTTDCRMPDQSVYWANASYGWNSVQFQGKYGGTANTISHDNQLVNNKIYGNNLHGLIDMIGYMYNITIRDNEVYDTLYSGIYTHGNTSYNTIMDNITIHNNTFHDIRSTVLTAAYWHNSTISNNTFYNATSGQVSLSSRTDWYAPGLYPDNLTIEHNIIYNASEPGTDQSKMWLFETGLNYTNRAGENVSKYYTGTAIYKDNNITSYLFGYKGTVTVQDNANQNYTFGILNNATAIIQSINGNVFNVSKISGSTYKNETSILYYSDRSNYSVESNNSGTQSKFRVNIYNITVRPSGANVTATNTTSNIAINQQNNTIGHIYVNFSAPIPPMNISLSNVSSGTNLSLRYAGNGTEIASYTVGANLTAYFNNSLGNDNYNVTQNASQGAPAAPAAPASEATTRWDTYRNDTSTWELLGHVLKLAVMISIIVCIVGTAKGNIKPADTITIITFDVIILIVVYTIVPIIGSLIGRI